MHRILLAAAAVLTLAGCSPGASTPGASPSVTAAAAPSLSAVPAGAGSSTTAPPCGAFWSFYSTMTSTPPSEGQAADVAAARQVAVDAHQVGRFAADADALLADVSRVDFPSSGNVLDGPIQKMLDDCSPGSS